jgi:hypothetical protein
MHRKPVYLRVSLKLKSLAHGIAKSGKVPVFKFRLLGFSMLVSVPLPSILPDIYVAETAEF